MSLEEEMGQSAFKNNHQKALINLLYTHNHVADYLNGFFKQFDITRQQYNVLRILRGQHPNASSINLIKGRMLEKMSDASRIVERLRVKGLVERRQSENDRRAVDVVITQQGLELVNSTEHMVDQLNDLFSVLSNDEAQTLNVLLDKVRSSGLLN